MDLETLKQQQQWIEAELDRCVRFWLEHGMDSVYGGIYTCLDRKGEIYSTDKSVWMQGRAAWVFAYLCSTYGVRPEWLEASKSCLDFMEAHCINREKGNRMYFTVTADGRPLRQRRYCFSEGFYTIANAEYAAITKDQTCMKRARDTYELIWKLNRGLMEDPVGMGPKTMPETRQTRALADPMIYLNISSVMRRCDPDNAMLYNERSAQCAEEIIRYHYKPELHCTLESVGMNGEYLGEVTQGRIVNPGHDIECSWFLMEYARVSQRDELFQTALSIFNNAINAGWDQEYGGLLYFVDSEKKPPEAYEHDMKLWWPHNEILIASLTAYCETRQESYYQRFTQTLAYCRKVFSDPEYGEWYGYLRRDGKPTMPSTKGSTFKGLFHLPRSLIMTDLMISGLLAEKA